MRNFRILFVLILLALVPVSGAWSATSRSSKAGVQKSTQTTALPLHLQILQVAIDPSQAIARERRERAAQRIIRRERLQDRRLDGKQFVTTRVEYGEARLGFLAHVALHLKNAAELLRALFHCHLTRKSWSPTMKPCRNGRASTIINRKPRPMSTGMAAK